MKKRRTFSAFKHVLPGLALLAGSFFLPVAVQGQAPPAADTADANQQAQAEYSAKVKELVNFLEGRSDTFEYQRADRPDPFLPFIKEKVVTSEVEIPAQELVGMQKFEPGQLTLVAIVVTERGHLAMVQDSVGRGYIISNGTPIGRSGVVDRITANQVVIKQRYQATSGEERYNFVEMFLKKEGETQQ
jgi:type IV pilus assembly protein PilP